MNHYNQYFVDMNEFEEQIEQLNKQLETDQIRSKKNELEIRCDIAELNMICYFSNKVDEIPRDVFTNDSLQVFTLFNTEMELKVENIITQFFTSSFQNYDDKMSYMFIHILSDHYDGYCTYHTNYAFSTKIIQDNMIEKYRTLMLNKFIECFQKGIRLYGDEFPGQQFEILCLDDIPIDDDKIHNITKLINSNELSSSLLLSLTTIRTTEKSTQRE